MNDFEDRVRSALDTDVRGVDVEQLLDDVHRGTTRRRRRRAGAVIAASVLVIAGVTGVTAQQRGDDAAAPDPPPASGGPSPAPGPGLLDGARGVTDVAVASPNEVFRLTRNEGCTACSTVWRQDPSADGGWLRQHDFRSRDKGSARFGPVTHLTMAANGRDGWAWGARLYSTHDGGRTWSLVTAGPGQETLYGRQLSVTEDFAWSLMRTDRGTVLWRSPLGSDDWSTVDAPGIRGVSGMFTTDDRVGLETWDVGGLANPRFQSSQDGTEWKPLDNPCPPENNDHVHTAGSAAFILCADPEAEPTQSPSATAQRALGMGTWEVFGHSTGFVTDVFALAEDRLLIVHETGTATLLTSTGTTAVDLGLAPYEEIERVSSSAGLSLLTVSDDRMVGSVLGSTDGGLSWHRVG